MADVSINYLAVLVAAIVSMVIGALWYSPVLFGRLWMRLSGMSENKLKEMKAKGMTKSYLVAFIGALVMSYVLSHFVDYAEATTFALGMQTGFWIWLGFFATTMLGMVLWEGKPVKLYFLNIAHYLIVLLIIGGMLAAWK